MTIHFGQFISFGLGAVGSEKFNQFSSCYFLRKEEEILDLLEQCETDENVSLEATGHRPPNKGPKVSQSSFKYVQTSKEGELSFLTNIHRHKIEKRFYKLTWTINETEDYLKHLAAMFFFVAIKGCYLFYHFALVRMLVVLTDLINTLTLSFFECLIPQSTD